jgi:hypothetical protein
MVQSLVRRSAMTRSSFWEEHEQDLADPEYLVAFARESARIAAVDRVINRLDDQFKILGANKSKMARAAGQGEAAVRRLFTKRQESNPTIGTIEALANQVGMRVTLEKIPKAEQTRPEKTTRSTLRHLHSGA